MDYRELKGFTKGPWEWREGWGVVDSTNVILAVSGVSMPCGYVPKGDVSYANGKLIAAAPDLLAEVIRQADLIGRMREALESVLHEPIECSGCAELVNALLKESFSGRGEVVSRAWKWWCWDCMKEVAYNHIKRTEDSGACTGYCKEPESSQGVR